jgi:hypothetical protein
MEISMMNSHQLTKGHTLVSIALVAVTPCKKNHGGFSPNLDARVLSMIPT